MDGPQQHQGQPAPPGTVRCPRCSATIGPEQDWCLECGAPARTRLAPTPNWRLPTAAIGAIVLLAGVLLAFAFVRLTDDGGVPAGTTPTAVLETAPAPAIAPPPAAATPLPSATTTAPAAPVPPASTVPGQAPAATTPPPTTTTGTTASQTTPGPP